MTKGAQLCIWLLSLTWLRLPSFCLSTQRRCKLCSNKRHLLGQKHSFPSCSCCRYGNLSLTGGLNINTRMFLLTMHLRLDHSILTVVVPLSKDNSMLRQFVMPASHLQAIAPHACKPSAGNGKARAVQQWSTVSFAFC